MKEIVKNEFKKLVKGKIFIFELLLLVGLCCIAVKAYGEMSEIVLNNLPKSKFYSEEMKTVLSEIDGVIFAKLFLTDFIYKGYFSFFLIFVVIIAVNTFSVDRESGNMKFALLTGVDKNSIVIGKIIYMICAIFVSLVINLVLSLTIGIIFFGISSSPKELMELILLNFFSILPATAITVFIALISQIRISSMAIVAIGIVFALLMGILDTTTLTYHFSPIGALSRFASNYPRLDGPLITCYIVSIAYICVGVVLIKAISKKYEYYE